MSEQKERGRRPKPLMERFWSKVAIGGPDDCWEWKAGARGGGYGSFSVNRKNLGAHRWLFTQIHGPIPINYDVCHSCDNRRCVNPAHLFKGTRSDNMRDCANKGRNILQRKPQLSHFASKQTFNRYDRDNTKLNRADIVLIRAMSDQGYSSAQIAPSFGVHAGHIRKIVSRKLWPHVQPQSDGTRALKTKEPSHG